MEYRRSDRIGDLVMRVAAELLSREIRDPRLQWLNLTAVKVSKDLRHATIYFSLLGDAGNRDEAMAGLKRASGFLRSKIGQKLNLRFVPAFDFVYDESEEEARRIDALLSKLRE